LFIFLVHSGQGQRTRPSWFGRKYKWRHSCWNNSRRSEQNWSYV